MIYKISLDPSFPKRGKRKAEMARRLCEDIVYITSKQKSIIESSEEEKVWNLREAKPKRIF
jgi:hypothetical protein